METITKYYVKYKIDNPSCIPIIKACNGTYIIRCNCKQDAMRQGHVMNYDYIKYVKIYSVTYAKVLNASIPVKKENIFIGNIKR